MYTLFSFKRSWRRIKNKTTQRYKHLRWLDTVLLWIKCMGVWHLDFACFESLAIIYTTNSLQNVILSHAFKK